MLEFKTFNDLEFGPHLQCPGKAATLFFSNGYGVSVVRFRIPFDSSRYGSYTSNENEWELAVLKGNEDEWHLTYDTPITDDVIGHLEEEDVTRVMRQVQELDETK